MKLSFLSFLLICCTTITISATAEQASEPFVGTVESLERYECPEWFGDAKFGIWSCWNAYTVPGVGDWYARLMYIEGSSHYKYHVANYGHPSEFGYKDIIPLWKGEKFNPEEQIELFKKAGAKYFVAMANHHDNFDLWDSKHQKWNSVNYGPKIDIIGAWRKATLRSGLRFGLTSHLERTWSWFQTNKGADKNGPYAGIPYDGNDPKYQDLYLKPDLNGDDNAAHPVNAPVEWREHWLERCQDVIQQHDPDMFYVDGGVPFYGDDEGRTGLEMIAYLYNNSLRTNEGKNEAVMCIKNWAAKKGRWGYYWPGIATLDVERGRLEKINPDPWQTDTSIGDWTWNRNTTYRSAREIIHELVDIVSKNGNLLLNVSPRDDGSLDADAVQLLEDIGDWMAVNSESIYESRYWKIWGIDDFRIVQKEGALYVTTFDWPTSRSLTVPFLALHDSPAKIAKVELLGHNGALRFENQEKGLVIRLPECKPCDHAWVFKISGERFDEMDLTEFNKTHVNKADKTKIWFQVSKKQTVKPGNKAVSFGKDDALWGINAEGFIFTKMGDSIEISKQRGIDIGAGLDGTVAAVGIDGLVYSLSHDGWQRVEGITGATRIDVDKKGKIWVLHREGKIAYYDGSWHTITGTGKDIGCGPDGLIAIVAGNGRIHTYAEGVWTKHQGGKFARIDVSPKTGHMVMVDVSGKVFVNRIGNADGTWKDLPIRKWQRIQEQATDVSCGQVNDDEIIGWINPE
ncbi:alpha-L-fucosidase [Pontiella sulfatireligans]|nr:alpha-L-fucosidase [Pontiella sulfatireligans]